MEQTPPGLSVTFTWNSRGSSRSRSIALGSAVRVALMVSLSAACYEIGRWKTRIEDLDSRPDNRVVIVEKDSRSGPPEARGLAAGGPVGEKDEITPLNVRDPAALVFPPFVSPPPAAKPHASEDEGVPEAPPPKTHYRKVKDIKPTRRF